MPRRAVSRAFSPLLLVCSSYAPRLLLSDAPCVLTDAGHPDGTWSVDLPAAEVPPEMPEPVLGINFARNGMQQSDWLSLCAIHSDSWLMSLLFFFGARFNCTGRAELFALANQHPTIYEVVSEKVPRNVVYKRQDGGEAYMTSNVMGMGASTPGAPSVGAGGNADDSARAMMNEPAMRTEPSGKIIGPSEFTTALCGKRAELFWPDDRMWYLVEIQAIDMETKMAKVRYATQEEEELNLLEVIEDGQMSLLG
ncbi:MAG: alfin [bacterium]